MLLFLLLQKEWLCLNCQTQRALSGQLGDMPPPPSPSKLPAKHEPTPPSSPAHAVSSLPSSPAPTATPAKGLTRMPSITQALDDKSEPVSAKVDAKDVKNTDTEQGVTAEPIPNSTQVVPEETKKQAPDTLTENAESITTPPEQTSREDTADVKGANVEQVESVQLIEAPPEIQKAEKSEPEQCQVQDPEYANKVETEPENSQEVPICNNVTQTLLVSDMEAIPEKDIETQSTETSETAPQIEMTEPNACSPINKEPHSQTREKQSEELTLPSNVDAVDNMSVKESSIETATTDPDQSSIGNVPERKPEASVQFEAPKIECSDDRLSHNFSNQEESAAAKNKGDQLKNMEHGVIEEANLENKLTEQFKDHTELTPQNNLNVCDTEERILQIQEIKDPFKKSEVTSKDSNLMQTNISVDKKDEISEKSTIEDKIEVEDTSQIQLGMPSPSPVTEQCTKEQFAEKEDTPLETEQMSTDKSLLEKLMPDQAGGDLGMIENAEQKVTIQPVSDNNIFKFGPESTFSDQGVSPDTNREEKKMGDTCSPVFQEADPKPELKTSERDQVYEEKPESDAVITENKKECIVIRDELSSDNNKNVTEMVEQLLPEEKEVIEQSSISSGLTDQKKEVPSSPVVCESEDAEAAIEIKPVEIQPTQQTQTPSATEVVEKVLAEQKDNEQIPDSMTEKVLEQSAIPKGLTDQKIVISSPMVSESEDAGAVSEIKSEEMQSTQQSQTPSVNEVVDRVLPEQKDNEQIPDSMTEKALEQSAIPKGLTDQKIDLSSPAFSEKEDIKAVIEIKSEEMQSTQQAQTPAVTFTISREKDKLPSEGLTENALVVTDQNITKKTELQFTADCLPHSLDHDVELASPSSTFSQQERNKSEELTSEAQERQDDVLQPLIKPIKIDESGEVTVHVAVEVILVRTYCRITVDSIPKFILI